MPALTLGDADTGIYGVVPNVISAAVNGGRALTISEGSATVDMNSAGDVSLFLRNNTASGAVNRGAVLGVLNESSVPVASMTTFIQSDGGSQINLEATPAGSRASDRRVLRATIPGSGPIALVGPVNVSSGDLDVAGNLRFNSGYGSAALAYGVRAWVNFNGTGTVAIRASGGMTSITDNGTGDYTANFNFTMPDANYAPAGITGNESGNCFIVPSAYATTNFRFLVIDRNTSFITRDQSMISLMFVR